MKRIVISLFSLFTMISANAQGLVGGLDSGGAATNDLSSVVGGLSSDVLSSTLFYEYEDEHGYITDVQGVTIANILMKLTPDGQLLIQLSADDAAQGAVLTISSPDGRQLAAHAVMDVQTIVPLPPAKIIIAKVEIKGKAPKVIKLMKK